MSKEKKWGGERKGAGRKSSWHTKGGTCTIRVPQKLASEILEYARRLDKSLVSNVGNIN